MGSTNITGKSGNGAVPTNTIHEIKKLFLNYPLPLTVEKGETGQENRENALLPEGVTDTEVGVFVGSTSEFTTTN